MDENGTVKDKRSRAVRSAAATSLLSKGGNIILQIVAIPIAIRVLGVEEFGVFATVASVLGFLYLADMGVGAGLTNAIARCNAERCRSDERIYLSTALVFVGVLAAFGIAIGLVVIESVPVATLLGESYAPYEETVRRSAGIGLAIVALQIFFSVFERARAGYQETHVNNLWGAAGNLMGGVFLGTGVFLFPTVEFLVVSIYGSSVVAKLGNAAGLIIARRYLVPSISCIRLSAVRKLFGAGLAFMVAQQIIPLTQREGCKLLIAHLAGPAAVGKFAILFNISTLLMGFVVMFTLPLWPAVADAVARFDVEWIRSATRKMMGYTAVYCAVTAVAAVSIGPALIRLWLGGEAQFSRGETGAFSFYFAAMAWSHVAYMVLLGMHVFKATAIVATLESLLLLTAAYLGLFLGGGLPGLFIGMGLSITVCSAWIFPVLLARRGGEIETAVRGGGAGQKEASSTEPSPAAL